MNKKLSFDFEADLAGAPRIVGSIDWLSSKAVAVKRVAQIKHKGFKGQALVVDTVGRHGFEIGEQVYLEGVGPTLAGFHRVIEHPIDKVDTTTCFAIEGVLPGAISPRDGLVRWLEEHVVINPEFLPLPATTELGGLAQAEQMQMLEVVAPEAYREMMSLLQSSAEGGEKAAREELTKLGQSLQGGLFDGKPLDAAVMAKLQIIKDRRKCREIEIACGMPDGLVSEVSGMRNAQQRVAQIYEYIVLATSGDAGNEPEPEAKEETLKKPKKPTPKKTEQNESGDSGSATADTAKQS